MTAFLLGFSLCANCLCLLGCWAKLGNGVPSRFWCAFWLIIPSALFGLLMAGMGSK